MNQIEEAGLSYVKDNFDRGCYTTDVEHEEKRMLEAFVAGAEWQAKQAPWISIDERMPEDEQLVLTSSSIYGVRLLVWNGHYNVWDDEDGDDVYCERDKIDAWMPIPE